MLGLPSSRWLPLEAYTITGEHELGLSVTQPMQPLADKSGYGRQRATAGAASFQLLLCPRPGQIDPLLFRVAEGRTDIIVTSNQPLFAFLK